MNWLSNLREQVMALRHDFYSAEASGGTTANARSIGGRIRAFLLFDSEGQSMVEVAFVAPVLMSLLVGIFAVGLVMQNYQQLTYAENQGLLALEQLPDTTAASDPCAAVGAAIVGAAGNLVSAGPNGIQVSLSFGAAGSTVSYPSSGLTSPTGFSCPAGSSYVVTGEPASLKVSYPSKVLGFSLTPSGSMSITEWEQI